MIPDLDILIDTYRSFNSRDIEAVLAVMHPEVDWPNGWQGGRVHGHENLRDYWTRQWQSVDALVEPQEFKVCADGRIEVEVHQVVRDLEGNDLSDGIVQHIYKIENGLILSMETRGD